MKILNGRELAGYIKERQAKAVRGLRQAHGVQPKIAIIRTNPDPVVDSYMRLKQGYGNDIGIEVDIVVVDQKDAPAKIRELNTDSSVHGMIVQIPLPDPNGTDEVLNAVAAEKDVDGLASKTTFDPATPMAIIWLLAGYNIKLEGLKLVIVGRGRLVGAPLARMWEQSGLTPLVANRQTNLNVELKDADVIVTATGVPNLIKPDMIKPNAVVVDAGVATDKNGLVGDVDPAVRELPDITVTPEKGGVGPLTVCALFENVIRAAQRTTN